MKIDRPKCGYGNTQNPDGYCDGSHNNKYPFSFVLSSLCLIYIFDTQL